MPEFPVPVRRDGLGSTTSRRLTSAAAVLATTMLLVGCALDSSPRDPEQASATGDEQSDATDQEAAPAASGAYLDTLYSDALHNGVAPASPGTAYIEAAGERYEFTDIACTISEEPGREQLIVNAGGEITGSGHRLYFSRQVGAELGFNFENEHVQLSVLTGEGSAATMNNSMAQHARDLGEDPDWMFGEGESPLVRIVGGEVTAIGVLQRLPGAPSAVEGTFLAAATCP